MCVVDQQPTIESIQCQGPDLEIELTGWPRPARKHPGTVRGLTELENQKQPGPARSMLAKRKISNPSAKCCLPGKKTLESTLAEFEKEALDTSSKELKYTILQRNVDTSRNLYDLMVSRIKESNILQTANTSNIRRVEAALVPIGPVSPNKKRNLLLSVVLGLFFGCGLAFFFEYMDQTVRTEEDISQHFNLPVLSVIPKADKSVSYGAYH